MRISDWSSDVCSSDLRALMAGRIEAKHGRSTQEMTAISGALTLLTNAVMAWNAEQMQRVVTDGGPTRYPDAHLARIAPVAYKPINRNGVMRFRSEDARHLLLLRSGRDVKLLAGGNQLHASSHTTKATELIHPSEPPNRTN